MGFAWSWAGGDANVLTETAWQLACNVLKCLPVQLKIMDGNVFIYGREMLECDHAC